MVRAIVVNDGTCLLSKRARDVTKIVLSSRKLSGNKKQVKLDIFLKKCLLITYVTALDVGVAVAVAIRSASVSVIGAFMLPPLQETKQQRFE